LVTVYRLYDWDVVIPQQKQRFISSPQHPDWLWNLPSLLSNGYLWILPRVKQPGHEAG
jgi:hypothetical protein